MKIPFFGLRKSETPPRTSNADTAYLVGPGCLRLKGQVPFWRPVNGRAIYLQPNCLKRIVVLGLADISGAAFELIWKKQIEVIFLSHQETRIIAQVSPLASCMPLTRLQYQAVNHPGTCLHLARKILARKIDSTAEAARYFQQQGRDSKGLLAKLMQEIGRAQQQLQCASQIGSLLGIEGSVAARWWELFAGLLPQNVPFKGRRSHPSPDPVNAALSLGYTLLLSRAKVMLTMGNLDPQLGFLHSFRPGRPSLACDLIEPFRIPVVDRLVLQMFAQNQLSLTDFQSGEKNVCEMTRPALEKFLNGFEKRFRESGNPGFNDQMHGIVLEWDDYLRREMNHA